MADRAGIDAPSECCPTKEVDPRVVRRFDDAWARWEDGDGFPEMVATSTRLADLLREATVTRPTVLEIGSGTGALSVTLLEMGARSVHGIDLSPTSVDLARRRAAASDFGEQATFEVGDGADAGPDAYDWVVADRVLCCDAHIGPMLDAIIRAARTTIALSVPESRGWRGLINRPMWAAETVWDLLRGGCRGYVHDVGRIERRLAEAGFRPVSTARSGLWHVGVYGA